MKRVTNRELERYLKHDRVADALHRARRDGDERLTCQEWLMRTPPKRMIFDALYGDLLEGPRRTVLDVGGGLTSLSRELAQRHDYTLVDVMAHDSAELVSAFLESAPEVRAVISDWYSAPLQDRYEVVIANDLFPNVDQRLKQFVEAFLPRSGEIRLALTYYNSPRFYQTKRVDADEVMCMLAWDGRTTRACIEKYVDRVVAPNLEHFEANSDSPFENGRQVCLLALRGGVRC
jgi:hypothetical protein